MGKGGRSIRKRDGKKKVATNRTPAKKRGGNVQGKGRLQMLAVGVPSEKGGRGQHCPVWDPEGGGGSIAMGRTRGRGTREFSGGRNRVLSSQRGGILPTGGGGLKKEGECACVGGEMRVVLPRTWRGGGGGEFLQLVRCRLRNMERGID